MTGGRDGREEEGGEGRGEGERGRGEEGDVGQSEQDRRLAWLSAQQKWRSDGEQSPSSGGWTACKHPVSVGQTPQWRQMQSTHERVAAGE